MADPGNKYYPLTPALVRALTDKLYEKRKAAALEIEKLVKELIKQNRIKDLEKLIEVIEELTATPNGNCRKGGLIGLAAVAIGLGKNYNEFSDKLLTSALTCFTDADSRVRYFACESLYNVVKICRGSALNQFDKLFDVLWKLSSDSEQTVRSGAELLDRLIKEIVRSSQDFDVNELMLLIRERIYCNNSSNRRFIIGWLHTVLKMPNFKVTHFVPEVVDGLFKVLDDPSPAVHDTAVTVLSELLHAMDPQQSGDQEAPTPMINILVAHTNTSPPAREIALIWLNQFCVFYNKSILNNLSAMLSACLGWLHNEKLKASELNKRLSELVDPTTDIHLDSVVDVLSDHLRHEETQTRIASLNWIRLLHSTYPKAMFAYMNRLFPVLLDLLMDSADDVLMLDIMLITDFCSAHNQNEVDLKSFDLSDEVIVQFGNISPYLVKFCLSLLELFKADNKLMDERGIQIIRQLCLLLEPADVFKSMALLLIHKENDVEFLSRLVALMNRILLTANELFKLRVYLKSPQENDVVNLFECLYRCWCYQPICLLSLCLLSQNYQHAVNLAARLSELDLTVDILTELDRLVQLIESPILAYVRMDLLSSEHQRPLASVLSALLMLLPQTEAFNTLHKRLQAIPHLHLIETSKAAKPPSSLNFKELLAHFDKISTERKENLRRKHIDLLNSMARSS
ncbi:unnamed protein product [Bursaphelenchus okinawaensis]|uniref:Protein VAC14 homolog n=1 Tax=Bursaphelenchus okinawaensis TaxID=465554 RepID=A0A811JU20_9BILA|nr:unnamed protein product [Bursaphelenchus okinawaensis]CAG9083476.1 unnamed protein product [Bursaphelenchus okinawaensis]